jgi:glutamine amidotransferase
MCLLTFLPAGVQPNLDSLRIGATHNPDGHGYAIIAGDRLLTGRGMDAARVIAEFARRRANHDDGPALFHSRFGTHGSNSLANCHPLPVGGDPRTVIAHNGVLPRDVHPARGDRRSDTRIAAETFIPSLGPLRLARTRATLQRWMGPHNKLVILTIDPAFRQPAYLLNADQGIWHEQAWYSNDGFRPSPAPLGADWVTCRQCSSATPTSDDECWTCGGCLICSDPASCLCYTPREAHHRLTTGTRTDHRPAWHLELDEWWT